MDCYCIHSYFRYNVGDAGATLEEECLDSRISNNECSNANTAAYAVFLLSSIIIGIAATPTYTLGMVYLDEIIFPKYVALHLGVFAMTLVCGPLIGYGLGSAFLGTYVDPWLETTLTPSDPAWVGAWWIPYLVFALIMWCLSIPFLMFPRYLPDSYLVKQERMKEMARAYSNKYDNENSLATSAKMFPIQLKRLLCNPSYAFITLGFSIVSLFLQGVITFAPKFYEVQFDLTSATAGIIVGAIAIPGGCTLLAFNETKYICYTL